MRLSLLTSNAFSAMTIHVLSNPYPIRFLPQYVLCPDDLHFLHRVTEAMRPDVDLVAGLEQ